MDADECVAAVMKEDAYLKITTDVEKTHCNKVITSELLFTVSNAYPVREELSKPFGYAVGELVNNGQYSKYREERKTELLGEPFCGDEVNEDSGEFEKLDHDNLFAPMFISFSSTTIGLLVCFFPKLLKKRRLWTRKEEDAIRDDDDTPETVKCEDTLTTNTNSVSNVLMNPSLTEILDILSSSSSKELDAAMEKLPDQSALLELCLQNNPIFLSNERLKDHLLSLTWSELLNLCRPIGQRTINEIMKYVSIYDKSNPKIRLQYTILTNPATRVALMQQLSDRLPLVSKNTGISTISSKTHSTGPPPNQQFDPVLSAYLNQISARSVATSADESNDSMARRKFDLETNPSNLYSEHFSESQISSREIMKPSTFLIYLSTENLELIKQQFETKTLTAPSFDSNMILQMKIGLMKPNNGSNSINVLKMTIRSLDHVKAIVTSFLQMHDCVGRNNDSGSSLILTPERRVATIAKDTIREFSIDSGEGVHTFVGKAGQFLSGESRNTYEYESSEIENLKNGYSLAL